MCKQDISPPKRRQSSSSSSSRPQASAENGQRRAAGTSVDPREEDVVIAMATTNEQRGSGNEIVEDRVSVRSSSLSSQGTDTSATPLLAETGSTDSVYGGGAAVIMLTPVTTETEREQVDGEQEITVIDIEDAPPPTSDDGTTPTAAGGDGEHDVSVDIEGGVSHESGSAPVVNA